MASKSPIEFVFGTIEKAGASVGLTQDVFEPGELITADGTYAVERTFWIPDLDEIEHVGAVNVGSWIDPFKEAEEQCAAIEKRQAAPTDEQISTVARGRPKPRGMAGFTTRGEARKNESDGWDFCGTFVKSTDGALIPDAESAKRRLTLAKRGGDDSFHEAIDLLSEFVTSARGLLRVVNYSYVNGTTLMVLEEDSNCPCNGCREARERAHPGCTLDLLLATGWFVK
jgi:hypothetical protein